VVTFDDFLTIKVLSGMRIKSMNFLFFTLLFLGKSYSQCLDFFVNQSFPNNEAIIGLQEVVYTSAGDLWITIGANQGDKFLLFKNGISAMPANNIYFSNGDILRLIPNSIGVATISITSDEPGCNNWAENNTVIQQPLPIVFQNGLNYFLSDKRLHLEWSVATQLNNEKYLIEHSKDGSNFSSIGEIAGDGTSNKTKHYEYIHTSPSIGINYYRIKQVDYDGQYSYSDIARVRYNGYGESSIYPNPATSEVTIAITQPTTLKIMDVYGRVFINQAISEGQNTINLSELASGFYVFLVGDQRHKVLKE
jgi:hypothetical protein